MKPIALFLVAAMLLGGVWWWRRGREPEPPAARRAPEATGSAARPAVVVPPPPRRPADAVERAASDPVAPPVADSVPFEHEARDAAWAGDQERELTLRLDRVGADLAARDAKVTVTSTECRRSLCRIGIAAAGTAELSALYGALETPEGLYGWADAIVLGEVDTDVASGQLTTHVLVQFDR